MELAGFQQDLAFYIINNCISKGILTTSQISSLFLHNLALNKGYSKNSLKTSIQRLSNKNIIRREGGKRGKGGYYVFAITEQIRNAYLSINKDTIGPHIEHELGHNRNTNRDTSAPNNNSISILSPKNTNTPLEENGIPVSKGQLNIFDLPPQE